MQSDELEGQRARLPDGRVGHITEVNRFDRMDSTGYAVVEVHDQPGGGEVVLGIQKAEKCVRAARIDPDVDDRRAEP